MILKKWILAVLIYLSPGYTAEAVPQYAFRISFTNKAGSPPLSNPLAFLSQRSLDRRAQQGIAVANSDRPVSPDYIDSVLTITQGKLHVTSRWLNSCVVLLEDSSQILLLQGKSYISAIKLVGFYVNPLHKEGPGDDPTVNDAVTETLRYKTTADPGFYNSSWNQTDFLKGQCLHDQGWMGQGKLIAVLDDGFNYVNTAPGFDSLYNSGRIVDKYNFVKADTSVYGTNAHGTHVLSTMAAYVPDTYVGSAPLAQYALYITEELSTEQQAEMDQMIAGFERADSVGADVVSSSLGYDVFFGMAAYSMPMSERDGKTTPAAIAVNMASEKGMLMVITAGNEGSGGILTPGDADSALTVGSMDIGKNPSGISGHGPNGAGHTKPEVCALGAPGSAMGQNSAPFNVNGTSIATPQVAGFAACLWQGVPNRKSWQVKEAILRSSDRYSNPLMPQHGYGVPDFCEALVHLDVPEAGADIVSAVYPNPFAGQITIALSVKKQMPVLVSLLDITGREVLQQQLNAGMGNNQFNLVLPAGLSPGFYLLTMKSDTGVQTRKLVKE